MSRRVRTGWGGWRVSQKEVLAMAGGSIVPSEEWREGHCWSMENEGDTSRAM